MKVKSFSRVWLFATPWAAAHQAPPSMGFSRQECWSGVPLPSPAWLPTYPLSPTPSSHQILVPRIRYLNCCTIKWNVIQKAEIKRPARGNRNKGGNGPYRQPQKIPTVILHNPTFSFQPRAVHYRLAFQDRGHFLVLVTGQQMYWQMCWSEFDLSFCQWKDSMNVKCRGGGPYLTVCHLDLISSRLCL